MTDLDLLSLHGFLALGFCAIFFYQGAINYFIHRQGILLPKETFYITWLCLFSGIYAFGSFYLVQEHPPHYNTHVFMSNWVSGSLIVTFYIKTLQTYFGLSSRLLTFLAVPPMLSAFCAFLAEALYLVFDVNIRLDPQTPFLVYENIFMAFTGGHNPHLFIKSLVPLFLIPSLTAIIIFFRHLIQKGEVISLISIGMVISFFGILIDGTMAVDDGRFKYMPPILFLSNFFEILRITYDNQIKVGKRITHLENDLIQSHKLAEAGDYFAKLSHEVANPLYAARSYFELLLKKIDQDGFSPKMKRYQENIESQFSHIEDILTNVKDLTRPTPTRSFNSEDLSGIINSSLEMTRIKAYHSGVAVEVEASEALRVSCYRDQLVQVLSNLISNGIEAVQEKSGWVKIRARKSKNGALISVTDSGSGIPEELVEKVFEKRFTTKEEKGNGLGLSICKTIVENHRGKIYVNQGSANTEFVVWLPMV